MFSKVFSSALCGTSGILVQVETDINDGLPCFSMVGFLSSCVREASERVRTALKNSGYPLPPKKITINLSPAYVRKDGTAFDLPIAMGILASLGIITEEKLESTLIIGELSLDGKVNPVKGVLPMVHHACMEGYKRCIVPKDNGGEAALIREIEVIAVGSIKEIVSYLIGDIVIEPSFVDIDDIFEKSQQLSSLGDFSEIKGQKVLKRGMEIAAAGLHNVIMTGAAGAGKSMIAKRLPTVLPKLTFQESIEITKIYSVAGLLKPSQALISVRPFRAPHHTVSPTAISGGGVIPKPGEVSLSHRGVLFLDELPEFSKAALEVMRQPLEDREIQISRLNHSYRFPADFMLVAARNNCPCGNYPDINKCTCTYKQINGYRSKISKPLLDRIDINVNVKRVNYQDLFSKNQEETSEEIRKRVFKAQEIQQKRYKNEKIKFNSQLDSALCEKYVPISSENKEFMQKIYNDYELSARGSNKILKVARTIADLDSSQQVELKHLKEALFYREDVIS